MILTYAVPTRIHINGWQNQYFICWYSSVYMIHYIDGILPKWRYPPCLRMTDRDLLAGYPRWAFYSTSSFYIFGVFPWNWAKYSPLNGHHNLARTGAGVISVASPGSHGVSYDRSHDCLVNNLVRLTTTKHHRPTLLACVGDQGTVDSLTMGQ